MRICVVRLSALGDVVMTIPLIRTLQKAYPKASITWIVAKPFDQILKNLEGVNVIAVDKVRTPMDYMRNRKRFSKLEFDLLLGCQASMPAHLFYSMIRSGRKIGFDSVRSRDYHGLFIRERIRFAKEHSLEAMLQFAKHLGIGELSYDGEVPLSEEDQHFVDEKFGERPFFIVHPCASREEKNYPIERLTRAVKHLYSKTGFTCVITGGPSDRPYCTELSKRLDIPLVDLVGKTSMTEMAACLKEAQVVLTPDTGPMHIASAYHTPTIALFAATNPIQTGPYYDQDYVVDQYHTALKEIKGVKNPQEAWNERVYHKDAMALIEVKEVEGTIDRLVQKHQLSRA